MALLETGRVLHNEQIQVKIKAADREESVTNLNFKIRLDLTPSHHQVLLCDVTDPQDPFFLYSLVLGESDFHSLKNEQRLLVDFSQFPSQLVKLLDDCKNGSQPPRGHVAQTPQNHQHSLTLTSPGSVVGGGGAGGASVFAVLNIVSAYEAIFSITESNQFRELQHLSLHFRKGNDAAVKEYLAAKFKSGKLCTFGHNNDLQTRLGLCEADNARIRESEAAMRAETEGIKTQLMTTRESMSANHVKEIADLKESHALGISNIQQKLNQERTTMEKSLREQIAAKTRDLEQTEAAKAQLTEKQYRLDLAFKQLTEKEEMESKHLDLQKATVEELRETVKNLETLKFQQEKTINEQQGRILTLEERVSGRENSYENQLQICKQIEDKHKTLESSHNENKAHCQELEDRCAESAAEIEKGNRIIANLQTQVKTLKSKLRVKTVALAQQEKAISELEKELASTEKAESVRKNELVDGKDRETRLCTEVDQYREKLNEAHTLIASNQQVIEYLNKQLTERDLKTFAPLSTVNLPIGRDTTSTRANINIGSSTANIGGSTTGIGGYSSYGGPNSAALPSSAGAGAAGGIPGGSLSSTARYGVSPVPMGTPGTTAPHTGATDAEARQRRIEALLQSRGVPLVGPVKYLANS